MSKSVAIIPVRFQAPVIHEGQKRVILSALAENDSLCIVLNDNISMTDRNPLDAKTRVLMVKKYFDELKSLFGFKTDFNVLAVKNFKSDAKWVAALDEAIDGAYPGHEVTIYGGRDSCIPTYEGNGGKNKTKVVGMKTPIDMSATELRNGVEPRDSEDFRAGMIYVANKRFPVAYSTVDISVLRKNRTEVLLGKKPNEDGWRFIGGFVDPADETKESAAKRELWEEVGMIEVSKMEYICSTKILDWRYKGTRDSIMTTFFCCDYIFGAVRAADDIEDIKWFPINDIKNELVDIEEEHKKLMSALMTHLKF